MEQFVLPPSPNWHLSNILACSDNGIVAFGSRGDLATIDARTGKKFDVTIIAKAHKERITVVVFSPAKSKFKDCVASCGEDGVVRVWNITDSPSTLLYCHSGHKDGVKVTGLDWSRANVNRLVSVNDLGSIVCWDLTSNTIRKLHCGVRVLPLCLACCPHDQDIVAVGCKSGVILVINIKGSGKIIHRLRGNDQDVISVSWCPVPYNVITCPKNNDQRAEGNTAATDSEKPRELLLATSGLDRHIYIWRSGTDGRFEVVLSLPNHLLNNVNQQTQRKRGVNVGSGNLLWVAVHWVDAYTLLSCSQYGELLSWDLGKLSRDKKRFQPKLLHSQHYKGCFSIACPVIYDVVRDTKADGRLVWTTAMDKNIMACSLASGNMAFNIPTLGGAVYCMALSPLDPNRLAIGSNDSKVFVWNMSNLQSLNITPYWRKIFGKVMALCWHPTEENLLAYGTGDGHVALLDVGSNNMPTILRLYHRKSVYRLCWAPPLFPTEKSKDKVVLFSVADGDVCQYTADPNAPDEEPTSLNSALLNNIDTSQGLATSSLRTEIVFKPDNSCFAVANLNGSVYVIDCKTLTVQHVLLYTHKNCINQLEWHPETVTSENSISPYKNWLLTASENIKVFNVLPDSEGKVELVATLSGHSEKVVSAAWSPHHNGRLVSTSYDYSVQVWDVLTQSCLGVCLVHRMAVMCALFSPLDADIIISGSSDNTVRLLSVSHLEPASAKPNNRKERVDNVQKMRNSGQEARELTVNMPVINNVEAKEKKSRVSRSPSRLSKSPTSDTDHDKVCLSDTDDHRMRIKGHSVFKVTGPKLAQAKHFDTYFQRWAGIEDQSQDQVENPSVTELGYLDFFSDDKAMCRLLSVEEENLRMTNNFSLAQMSMLWRGNVSEMIVDAITKKKLSDWLVSLSPLVGFEKWEEACIAYADQLVESGNVLKAASYLLAVHRIHDAVQLLLDYKMFKEAACIAKCRLVADDTLITQVYDTWGNDAKQKGNLPLAAHCFLSANNTQQCISILAKAKDLKSLQMAIRVAGHTGQTAQMEQLTKDCLTLCVMAGNFSVAQLIIGDNPQYQYWQVWLQARELLTKVKNRNEVELFDWLEGRRPATLHLWTELASHCTCETGDYDKLLPHLYSNKTPDGERDMWVYVSGQLAAAHAASWPSELSLRHTVSALSAAYHHQTSHPSSLALLYVTSLIVPQGLFAEESILNMEKKIETSPEVFKLIQSLNAFVCASVVHWMHNNWEKVTKLLSPGGDSKEPYKMQWLPELLENCSEDVLKAENVKFFVKKAQRQGLQNAVTQENIKKTYLENRLNNDTKSKQTKNIGKNECITTNTEVLNHNICSSVDRLDQTLNVDIVDKKDSLELTESVIDQTSIDQLNKNNGISSKKEDSGKSACTKESDGCPNEQVGHLSKTLEKPEDSLLKLSENSPENVKGQKLPAEKIEDIGDKKDCLKLTENTKNQTNNGQLGTNGVISKEDKIDKCASSNKSDESENKQSVHSSTKNINGQESSDQKMGGVVDKNNCLKPTESANNQTSLGKLNTNGGISTNEVKIDKCASSNKSKASPNKQSAHSLKSLEKCEDSLLKLNENSGECIKSQETSLQKMESIVDQIDSSNCTESAKDQSSITELKTSNNISKQEHMDKCTYSKEPDESTNKECVNSSKVVGKSEESLNIENSDENIKSQQIVSESTRGSVNGHATLNTISLALGESDSCMDFKLKEIKELEEDLQRFQSERVSVPCPFTAYMDMKYVIDKVVSQQDSQTGLRLQEICDQLWVNTNR